MAGGFPIQMAGANYRTRHSSSRRKTGGRIPRRRSKGGWRTWFLIWLGCLLLMAGAWLGYRLWKQTDGAVHRPEAGKETYQAKRNITLFFSDEQAEFLVAESREVADPGSPSALAQAVMEELLRGPKSGLQPTIPAGTRILDPVSCSQGVCTVDFSEEFVIRHPGGTSGELMTVYSVVESLCANVPGVKKVHFLVAGKPRETLAGHLFIGAPVASEPSLLKREVGQKP